MKTGALVLFVSLVATLRAADLPSFDFKANVFPLPPLKLGDGLNKPPTMTFNSPAFQTPFPDRFRPTFTPKFDPKMRIVKPRSDINFKLIVKEPDPNLDPKFVVPAPQPPVRLGRGK